MIYLLLIAIGIAIFSPESDGISIYEVVMLSLILIGAFISILNTMRSYRSMSVSTTMFFLSIYLLIALLSGIWAVFSGVEVTWWIRRFVPILLFFLATIISSNDPFIKSDISVRHVISLQLYLLVIIVILALYPYILSGSYGSIIHMQDIRQYGGGFYSAFLTTFLLPYILLRRYSYFIGGKFFVLITFYIALGSLVMSYTRTYWVSTAISALLIYLIGRKIGLIKRTINIKSVFYVIISLFLILIVVPKTLIVLVKERILEIFQFNTDLSFLDRMSELKGIIDTSFDNPFKIFLGQGLGSKFTFYSVNPFSWGGTGWITNDYTHNYYAYIYFGLGIFGLLIFIIFWIYLFIKIYRFLIDHRYSVELKLLSISILGVCINLLVALNFAPPLASYEWNLIYGMVIGIFLYILKAK
jgi:O-antigen ligase